MGLIFSEYMTEQSLDGLTDDFLTYMKGKGYVNDDGIINVSSLLGSKQSLGNGTASTDIYKLEKSGSGYVVNYYETSADTVDRVIWKVAGSGNVSLEELKNQISNNDGDCMIDENGNIFPIDKWSYEITGEDMAQICSSEKDEYDSAIGNAYNGGITEAGKLEYEIPVYIKKDGKIYIVNQIGERALESLSITSVNIPTSVTSIGKYAFESCKHLTSINIPTSVTSIEYQTFYGCTGLTSVNIPTSVTSIKYEAFSGCTGLTSINIPSSVTSIGDSAFSDCAGLTNVNVENGNTVYDSRDNCNAIIEKSTNELILGCKTTIIPTSVTSIGNTAFYKCTGLTSINIPTSVTSIGFFAFYQCTGLTSINIPSSVISIGDDAFYGCTGLTSINIPSSVTSIGDSAFSRCTGLTSINIPSSVTSIGSYAFTYCTGLTNVNVESGNTVYDSRDNCNAIIKRSTNELIFGCKTTIIPTNVKSIGRNAFSDCTGLTSINIPTSVTSIEYAAFSGCTGLTSINIPSSVKNIGVSVFYNWTASQTINFQAPKSGSSKWDSNWNYGCNANVNWNVSM